MTSRIRWHVALFVVCSTGLACWWPFFRNSYLGMAFYGNASGVSNGLLLGVVAFGIGLFGAICFFSPWTQKRVDAATTTVACVAALLSILLHCAEGAVASAASALCLSLAAASLALGWFAFLCRLSWPVSVSILATSFFLSFLLPYIAHFYGEGAMAFLNGALMPVSAGCLCAASVLLRRDGVLSSDLERSLSSADMKEMAVVLVLFLVVGAVFRGCFGQGPLDYSPTAEGEFRYVIALVLSGALIVFALSFSRQATFFVVVWAILAFAFFAGLVILSALALPADEIWSSVVITSRTFMGLLLWMVAVRFCQGRTVQEQVRCVVVLLLGVEAFCLLVTALVTLFAGKILGGFDPALVSCVMALVLVAGSFAYLISLVVRVSFGMGRGRKGSSRLVSRESGPVFDRDASDGDGGFARIPCHDSVVGDVGRLPLSPDGGMFPSAVEVRKAACRALSEEHGITEREEEVLYLLSLLVTA